MPDDVFIRKGIIARRRLAQYLDADVAWRDLFPELFDAIEKEGKITDNHMEDLLGMIKEIVDREKGRAYNKGYDEGQFQGRSQQQVFNRRVAWR
tara:strand:- start:1586 stop:1867 length:282 start_codon:yes stop_codon:yes gene_type:complete